MHIDWRAELKKLHWMGMPLLAFLVTRLGIALVAYVSMPLIVDSSVPPYHIKPDQLLLDVFGSRWDTGFYLSIAEEGYQVDGVPFPSVAFFPLLPLLIRAFNLLTGDTLVAGLLVTNLALVAACLLFYRLVYDEFGAETAGRAVWYFLIFPSSFFGSAIYSESLFLLCAIGALYLFRKGLWESAAMLGVLSAMTRFMGLLVAPLLLIEWWMLRRRNAPEKRPPLAALARPPAHPPGHASPTCSTCSASLATRWLSCTPRRPGDASPNHRWRQFLRCCTPRQRAGGLPSPQAACRWTTGSTCRLFCSLSSWVACCSGTGAGARPPLSCSAASSR